MNINEKSELYQQKKVSQKNFFKHYEQFQALIHKIDSILSGKSFKNLEGNEIRKSVNLLDTITKDLQGMQQTVNESDMDKEEYSTGLLRRKFRKDTKTPLPYSDIYDALGHIYTLDKDIAEQGIVELDTSIFLLPKTEAHITSNGGNNELDELRTAPKYETFCEAFQSMKNISLQECQIYKEKLKGEGRMRQVPYRIVYIPEPIMQTWCISDEIGQAIYIYDEHPLLETLIKDMKGGNSKNISEKLIWDERSDITKMKMIQILENGVKERDEGNSKQEENEQEVNDKKQKESLVSSDDMKLTLWAQNALMEAIPFLESIDMKYLGEGKWDLREMKGNRAWKTKIGGKLLENFPSATWNKAHGVGVGERGRLSNSFHIAQMLMSVGYREENIQYHEQKIDLLEWEEGMDEDLYKKTVRKELEKEEYRIFFKFINMKYLGEGKWDLRKMKGNRTWKTKIGGKLLLNFPSTIWNKARGVGRNKIGVLNNSFHIAQMLMSVGYREEDIQYHEQKIDSLEWKEDMDEIEYKRKAQEELEKEKYRKFLEFIGMKYLGEGQWDLREMKGIDTWKTKIGGKLLSSFPSTVWNKTHEIGIEKSGALQGPSHIAHMLVSVGYREGDIQYREQKADYLDWKEYIDEDLHKETVRKELEKKEYTTFFEFIGMKYLGDGKWDLRDMKGMNTWNTKIGGKFLMSFPNAVWNKAHKVGHKERGALQNPEHIADMLASVGYREEDIQRKVSK